MASFVDNWTVGPPRGKDASNTAGSGASGGIGVTYSDRERAKQKAQAAAPPPAAAANLANPDVVSKERTEVEGLLPKYKAAGDDYMQGFTQTGQNYLTSLGRNENAYQGQLQSLMNEAEGMGRLADRTYGDVSTRQRGIMNKAQSEAAGAMTLAQASDPNNPVAAAFRDFYEKQAQGTRQAGMADVGVMQALGAQAFGGQMGMGGPMTGGQMAAIMGQNQSQAGMAMANVQNRVQNLRDQGIAEGWNQTDKAYGRGVEARNYYDQSVGNYWNTHQGYQGMMVGLRGERAGYGQDMLGSRSRVTDATRGYGMDRAGLQHALSTGDLDRTLSTITSEYDRRAADRIAQTQAEAAKYAARQGKQGSIFGGLAAGAGAALGGYFGGPPGAVAGGTIGNSAGG